MTVNHSAQPGHPQLSTSDRRAILDKILATLEKRFYRPEKLDDDWQAAVSRHRPLIEAADTANGFEQSVSDLLAELHTSHLGFFHASARRASSRAALSATYLADETPFGKRWIFQDVHSGGAASKLVATSNARHCRVKLSITPRTRIRCPAAVTSLAKSKAHSWLGAVSTCRGCNVRRRCLRRVRFTVRPSSRYARCTFLWFTPISLCRYKCRRR